MKKFAGKLVSVIPYAYTIGKGKRAGTSVEGIRINMQVADNNLSIQDMMAGVRKTITFNLTEGQNGYEDMCCTPEGSMITIVYSSATQDSQRVNIAVEGVFMTEADWTQYEQPEIVSIHDVNEETVLC